MSAANNKATRLRSLSFYFRSVFPGFLAALVISLLFISACNISPLSNQRTSARTHISPSPVPRTSSATFPVVDANYTYDQLYYMSTTFRQRESGFDLSPEQNGHRAFAQYWVQEILYNLRGFGAQVAYDKFAGGWISRPADSSSYNVEVTIPGAVHPEQMVVVGSHYDGMHVSQGSAFDDTSGCAIMLGQARALGDYWRTYHLYPARTLRFVLFDAEEQGILGSYHYVNHTVNGDTANIVAMINQEQSGLSYPVRFQGKLSNPLIPLHIWNVSDSQSLPYFADLIRSALPEVAHAMRMLGYTSLTYHDGRGQPVSHQIFTPADLAQMLVSNDALGGSDDAAFDQANVPALTFVAGDQTQTEPLTGVDRASNIPVNQTYPYDTHDDTVQLMNGYANGETKKSQALTLSLTFQTMLSAWMLDQPAMVGHVSGNQLSAGPLAAISDIGIVQPGAPLALNAQASFDPRDPHSNLNARWDFGDGTQATGLTTQHTYAHPGTYTLKLSIQDASGTRTISKKLSATTTTPEYTNDFLRLIQQERDHGSELAQGDRHLPGFETPLIIMDGDGLTDSDHFPGRNP